MIKPNEKLEVFDIEDSEFYNIKSSYYNEIWSYSMLFDNGVHISYNFSVSEIGAFKKRVTGAKIMLKWVDNKTYVISKEYDFDYFEFNSESSFIKLHPERSYRATTVENGKQSLFFKTDKNGVEIEIEIKLSDIFQSVRNGSGLYKIGNEQFFMEYLIPKAIASGFIILNRDTLNVSGQAYMTHTYSTGKSTNYLNQAIKYASPLSINDSKSDYYINSIIFEKNDIQFGYGISYLDSTPTLISPLFVELNKNLKLRGAELITDFEITFTDENINSHHIVISDIVNHYSILDDVNNITKMFIKNIIGKELIEFYGVGEINEKPSNFIEGFIID